MTSAPGLDIDLNDLDLFVRGDVHDTFALLRRHEPVYWNADPDGSGGFWALTRHQDVFTAYNDPARLSSRHGTVMGGSYRRRSDSAGGRMLIASDAPEHRLLRQRAHPAFRTDVMERAGVVVRGYVSEALDRVLADGRADFADVALELPRGLLAVMFGLDRDEALRLLTLTRRMIGHQDPSCIGDGAGEMALVAAQMEIFDLMNALVTQRRRKPGQDVVSILLEARLNGRPMTESEILYNCLNIAVGGDETTPFTAAAAVEAFAEHPDQYDRLLERSDLLDSALNEIFRWTSTNAYVQRTARTDLEIGGQRIAAGESVTLWNVSANFDEAVFERPDLFDVAREPNRHLAFGSGPHRCIGQNAAWLEIKILLEELLARRMRLTVAGPVRRLRSNFMLGPTSLPVRVESHR
ncbi:Cytochrome P450 [Streptomyces sp. yr375]|uniref:cytochrome P450 n=1 Tax=Streptomyces sp. yr375 TaxID=1761906 RepID=UPI0008BFC552|nr:cytochrome P450 [Streptomyces sp. yr375]SES03206.1 Cytochrome P450 [Streptomyces sp. yr375]